MSETPKRTIEEIIPNHARSVLVGLWPSEAVRGMVLRHLNIWPADAAMTNLTTFYQWIVDNVSPHVCWQPEENLAYLERSYALAAGRTVPPPPQAPEDPPDAPTAGPLVSRVRVELADMEYGSAHYSVSRTSVLDVDITRDLLNDAMDECNNFDELASWLERHIRDEAEEWDGDWDYGDYDYDDHDAAERGDFQHDYSTARLRIALDRYIQNNLPLEQRQRFARREGT